MTAKGNYEVIGNQLLRSEWYLGRQVQNMGQKNDQARATMLPWELARATILYYYVDIVQYLLRG